MRTDQYNMNTINLRKKFKYSNPWIIIIIKIEDNLTLRREECSEFMEYLISN